MRVHLPSALGGAFAILLWLVIPALAQRVPLPLGVINSNSILKLQSCPAGYYPGMSCFRGTVEDCPNADNLSFTFGYENPSSSGQLMGTIVFFEGSGGTVPYREPTYAQTYLQQGYQVVYLAWDTDWEFTKTSTGNSIKIAACRPATFLQYINQNLYTRGGMCAQGESAGSGAVAYSLAWYGSSSYLDNVELLSGPVFGDIEQGCMVPNSPIVNVCGDRQYGCDGNQWPDSPAYVYGDQTVVSQWSGQAGCNSGEKTSGSANATWKQMSIVDGSDDPSFDYPQTAMAGWLCSNDDVVQNNSAAEGNFFYQQFTHPGQTAQYSVTRINDCANTEGVSEGQTPQGESGFNAISSDMVSACLKRH